MANNEKFICGVVEGFYGRPWTTEQRLNLFAKLKKWGMDTYLYAPKDDYKHRAHWRELYIPEEADCLINLIASAKENNINFYYALSPGLDITYSSEKEIKALKRKLDQVSQFGCECFALLFDDIESEMSTPDKEMFQSFANAQVSVTNEIYNHLRCPRFLFCPTQYCSSRAVPTVTQSEYLNTLGDKLINDICILWTGKHVISKIITLNEIEEITEVLKRKPVIWDNLHANDYDARRVFLGPYMGRDPSLIPHLRGVVTNPNCEFHANSIAIMTLALWAKCESDATSRKSISSADVKLETGNEGFGEEEFLSEKCYHPRAALKKAIMEWLPEFFQAKEAPQRTISKPQPSVAMVMPIIPSLNTCMALTTPSSTTTIAGGGMSGPEINSFSALESGMETITTTTAVINYNTLASPTKVMPVMCTDIPCTFPVSSMPKLPIMSIKVFESNKSDESKVDPAKHDIVDIELTEKPSKSDSRTEDSVDEITENSDNQMADESNKEADGEKMLIAEEQFPAANTIEPMDCGGTPKHIPKAAEDVVMANSFETTSSTSPCSMQIENNSDISNASDICDEKLPDNTINVNDIALLCDLFYLPFEHGKLGLDLLNEFHWLKSNARILNKKVGASELSIEEWNRRSDYFLSLCQAIKSLSRKLATCANKEICYDLFSYAWDISAVLSVLVAYVKWLALGHFPEHAPAHFSEASNFTWFSKSWQDAFSSGNQEPWTLRGGLISDLQRLIPIDSGNTDIFIYKLPDTPAIELYSIRPYRNSDEQSVYQVCREASDNQELYPGTLYADRMVGPFLTIDTELCLVVEDAQNAIVGYCCASLDSAIFHRNQEMCWMPEMKEKYPVSMLASPDIPDATKDLIKYFHNFIFECPEEVHKFHPSIMSCAILKNHMLSDQSLAKRLLTASISLLRSNGCFGVHAAIDQTEVGLRDFYHKLGFIEICHDDLHREILYLGRNF